MSELPNSDSGVTTDATHFQKPHKHPPALPRNRLKLKNSNIRIITHTALTLSGDIQLNPGPCSTIYPCGICEHPVTWSDVGLCCDGCNIWYHKSCIDLCTAELDSIGKDNVVWLCCKCETRNHISTLFHAFKIDLHNNYSILNDLNNNSTVSSITSPTAIFQPQTQSSPNTARRTKTTGSRNYGITPKRNNWFALVVNCNSKQKASELEAVTNYIYPDVIIGTESKLEKYTLDAEVFPERYIAYRKDRQHGGGGVFVAIKDCYPSSVVNLDSDNELIWVRVSLQNSKDMFIGSFYRPPNVTHDPFAGLSTTLSHLSTTKEKLITFGGDFNASGINWDSHTTRDSCTHKTLCQDLLNLTTEPVAVGTNSRK